MAEILSKAVPLSVPASSLENASPLGGLLEGQLMAAIVAQHDVLLGIVLRIAIEILKGTTGSTGPQIRRTGALMAAMSRV
jgi:hypothetical protein